MKLRLFLVAGALFFLLAGCSTKLPVEGVNAFYDYRYRDSIETFRLASKADGKDYVLYNLGLLSASFAAGNFWDAEMASLNAQRVMWSDAGKGAGTASLISAEALKVFKGEPFEKSMAAIYAGVIFFNRGEYDNARAAFSKAALAIKQKEKNRETFALAFFLQAKTFLKLGDADNARIALGKAKAIEPGNPYFEIDRLQKSNVLFLIELGQAPEKARTGPGASLIEWRRRPYPERAAQVKIDNQDYGWGYEAGDLTEEAQTKGWTGKDTVQVTKGATREAATVTAVIAADQAAKGNKTAGWVALGAGLFALANQSQADTRQWELLPDRLHVLPVNVEPGMHTVRIDFVGSGRHPLSSYTQTWYDIPVQPGDDRIFVFRSGSYKGVSRAD